MTTTDFIIDCDATIHQGLTKLSELRDISKLILFVSEKGKIIGTVTDGDIRRALVEDRNLDKPLKSICNADFKFIVENPSHTHLGEYLKKNINILPVLNAQQELVEIIDLNKIHSKLPLECMLMAGGRGKRLSPLTDTVPKPMLPLGGIPILERNIDHLIKFGIKKFYISVKYLGEQIVEHFGNGESKGIEIEYIWEEKPLGTAGALTLVDNFKSDNVLLMNSDLFTNVNIEDLYLRLQQDKAEMVVSSTEYRVDIPYAIFDADKDNKVKAFKEKPTYKYHSNAGIYILNKKLIQQIPKNEFFDITDLMDIVVAEGGTLIHEPIRGYWVDIGKPDDYVQAQDFIKHLI